MRSVRFGISVQSITENMFRLTGICSKNLEKEISLENYKKFAKTTARLDKVELFEAYKNSLLLVMDLQSHLIEQYNLKVTHDILERLLNYISE